MLAPLPSLLPRGGSSFWNGERPASGTPTSGGIGLLSEAGSDEQGDHGQGHDPQGEGECKQAELRR